MIGTPAFNNGTWTNTLVTLKGGAGRLHSIHVQTGAVAGYLQVLGATTDTLGTTPPLLVIPLAATAFTHIVFPSDVAIGTPGSATAAIRIAYTTTPTGSTAMGTLPTMTSIVFS